LQLLQLYFLLMPPLRKLGLLFLCRCRRLLLMQRTLQPQCLLTPINQLLFQRSALALRPLVHPRRRFLCFFRVRLRISHLQVVHLARLLVTLLQLLDLRVRLHYLRV
jgi:hypothetical protein